MRAHEWLRRHRVELGIECVGEPDVELLDRAAVDVAERDRALAEAGLGIAGVRNSELAVTGIARKPVRYVENAAPGQTLCQPRCR